MGSDELRQLVIGNPEKVLPYSLTRTSSKLCRERGFWRVVGGWFHPRVDIDSVGEDNLKDLLAWAFFYKGRSGLSAFEVMFQSLEDLSPSDSAWVSAALKDLCIEFDVHPAPGRCADVFCVRHTLDPVRAKHRPLLYYGALGAAKAMLALGIMALGFRKETRGKVGFWVRDLGRSHDDEVLVFFHGVGIGPGTYFPLLAFLPNSLVILPDMPWVSMDPGAQVIPSGEFSKAVADLLAEKLDVKGGRRLLLAGHSFGTLAVTWLLRKQGEWIRRPETRVVIIDPVNMLLCLPDVCINFLYKKPRHIFASVLRYICSLELGIARTLFRHFFWMDGVVFPSCLPEGRTTVIISEADHMVPAQEIFLACERHGSGVKALVLEGLDHGTFLLNRGGFRRVVRELVRGTGPGTIVKGNGMSG